MSCEITGCRKQAVHVKRAVSLKLPGHPSLVQIGDLRVCEDHSRSFAAGMRTNIRDDVITAALARRI